MKQIDLFGGPQDGGKVKPCGKTPPSTIYLGPKWLGDGISAMSIEPCKRFPVQYDLMTAGYYFVGFVKEP